MRSLPQVGEWLAESAEACAVTARLANVHMTLSLDPPEVDVFRGAAAGFMPGEAPRWPAWKCVSGPVSTHIQAHQPAGYLPGRRVEEALEAYLDPVKGQQALHALMEYCLKQVPLVVAALYAVRR